MSRLTPTTQFRRQYKHVRKDPRRRPIFEGRVPFEDEERSPWDYIMDCFLKDNPIPEYFYVHQLTLPRKVVQQLKKRAPQVNVKFKVVELHFDGHNGDHLLVYAPALDNVYLVAIGRHTDLF